MPEQSQPRRRATARKDDTPAAEEKPAAKAAAKDPEPEPADERIGQAVPSHWDSAGFEDGRRYRCEDGRIVERIN